MRAGTAIRAGRAPRFPLAPPGPGGPYNAPTFLTTPTPDGSGSATHPDVIDFGTAWNSYRYWMALTPFAGSDSTLENPCILASNDNLTWVVPPGLTNPIDPWPGGSSYNSDPDLIYGQDGKLYCIYRQAGDLIYGRTSTDGVTWSSEATILTTANNACLSPTILWDGTQYVMYSVNESTTPEWVEKRTASSITGTWSAPTTVAITWPGQRTPWHIDATISGGKTYLTINEGTSGGQGVNLSVAASTDGTTFTLSGLLMQPIAASWNGSKIYRASGTISGANLRLWYSAAGTNDWRIGYTTIPVSALP